MRNFLKQILPFIFAGIALVALAFGIMLLAYLFFIGALVGLVLYLISYLRAIFFPPKPRVPSQKPSGRIIDSDDWRKM